jgi:phage shock protein PspC (stress-responsive transcriptional regulator)
MKRTEKINLQGIVFNIDEDAFQRLTNYLKELETYFKSTNESAEIYTDIELRLIELLQAKLNENKQVINENDVEDVIQTLGKVGDFTSENTTSDGFKSSKRSRRLYRDSQSSFLGGVCSGLSAYLKIDVVWIRLAFVLGIFLNGAGILAYLIMWIIVPRAKTAAQRLEMQGEDVNINNIENNIREEYNRVKDNLNNWQQSDSYKRTKDGMYTFFSGMGTLFSGLLRLVIVLVGITFLLSGVFALLGISFVGAYQAFDFHLFDWDIYLNLESLLSFFIPGAMIDVFLIAIWLLVTIPVVAIVYLGLKLIFRFKANDKPIGALLLVAFIVSAVFVLSVSLMQVRDFDEEFTETERIQLSYNANDTLYLSLNDNLPYNQSTKHFYDEEFALDFAADPMAMYIQPNIRIEASDNDESLLIVRKKARGEDQFDAGENVNSINYQYRAEGRELQFDRFFRLQEGDYFRDQELDMIVKVPEGMVLHIPWDVKELIKTYKSDIERTSDRYYEVIR